MVGRTTPERRRHVKRFPAALFVTLALGACAGPLPGRGTSSPPVSDAVMARLIEVAAPYQDLGTVELRPEDGCYWYRHVGPVETTMLPLRSRTGQPICGPREAPAA